MIDLRFPSPRLPRYRSRTLPLMLALAASCAACTVADEAEGPAPPVEASVEPDATSPPGLPPREEYFAARREMREDRKNQRQAGRAAALGLDTGEFVTRRKQRRIERARRMQAAEETATMTQLEEAFLVELGYVEGTPDENADRSGVLSFDAERAMPGYNFLTSPRHNGARLLDMNGQIVHSWTDHRGEWSHAELLADGSVIGVEKNHGIVQLDSDSNKVWEIRGHFHHSFWRTEDGTIYALERAERSDALPLYEGVTIKDDFVTRLSPEGRRLGSISILDSIARSPFAFLLPSLRATDAGSYDLLHLNQVEAFDGSAVAESPLYAKGNLLVSVRNLDLVVILDGETHEILWGWGPNNLTRQHHPSLVEGGNILIFDNGETQSRMVEVDPRTHEIAWRYTHEGLFSQTRGSVYRLANGNTLITESNRGYVHEVTDGGDVVWQYANPEFVRIEVRAALWRLNRIPSEFARAAGLIVSPPPP